MSTMVEQEPLRSRRSFTDEFKRDAVGLVIDEGRRVIDVARSLGVGEGTLGKRSRRNRCSTSSGKCWHLINNGQDYAFGRPSLNAHKRRKLELSAGEWKAPSAINNPPRNGGEAQLRDQERAIVEQAEHAYNVMIAHWQPQKPAAHD